MEMYLDQERFNAGTCRKALLALFASSKFCLILDLAQRLEGVLLLHASYGRRQMCIGHDITVALMFLCNRIP